ncbi:MAG: GAF domain-containing protein [Chloroflexia bacterium]
MTKQELATVGPQGVARATELAGDAPLELGEGLAILAGCAMLIGRTVQATPGMTPDERTVALLEANLAYLRDRVGYEVALGVIGDGDGAPNTVRCLLAPTIVEAESLALADAILPILAGFQAVPARPNGLLLLDPDTGQPDPRIRALVEGYGLRAALAIPLVPRQSPRVAGAILLGSRKSALGRLEMLQLLELIGGQIGTALSYSATTERLRQSEERARILTEEANDGIYTTDAEGRLTYVNPQLERQLGYSREELLGKRLGDIALPRSAPKLEAILARATTGDLTPSLYDLDLRGKDGQVLTLEINARNLYDNRTGRYAGRLGVSRDITERRRLEAELARRNRALEALTALATLAGQATNLDTILEEALARTLAVFEVDSGAIHLLDEARDELILAVQRGYGPGLTGALARMPAGRGLAARVLTEAGAVAGTDMATDAVLAEEIRGEGIGGFACIALRSQERPVGLLGVTWREPHLISAADGDTLSIIGAQLGAAIENARLAAEATASQAGLEDKTAQLSRLLAVSAGFAANLPLDEVLTTVARAIVETIGFGSAHVRVRTPAGDALVGAGFWGHTPEHAAKLRPPTPIGFYHRMLQERFKLGGLYYIPHNTDRRTILEDDWTVVRRSVPTNWQPGQWHPEDALVVPLRASGGALLGVIYADEPSDGRVPDAEKVAVLELFGRQAALAIENAELYAQVRHDLRRQDALREVIEHISAELDLDRLLEKILADAVDLLGGDAGAFGLIDSATGISRIGTINNMPAEILHAVIHAGQGLTGTILETGQPVLIDDYAGQVTVPAEPALHSCLGVPVYRGDELVGTFFVGSTQPQRRFGPRDVETLELFAKHAALALGNAALYEDARSQHARLVTLRDVIERISSELDLQALLNRLAVSAVELLEADWGTIALVEEESGTARIEAGFNMPPGALGRQFGPGEGLSGLTLAERGPVLLGPDDSQPMAPEPYSNPARAHIGVPIWWQDRLIGTFGLSSAQPGKVFTPGDVDMLALLARHAAVAIENAGLYSALQERFSQVEAISAVGTALVEERDLERVLSTVAAQVMGLLDADGCSVWLLDADEEARPPGKELALVVSLGLGSEEMAGRRLPLNDSYTGTAIMEGGPVVVEDLSNGELHPTVVLGKVGIDTMLIVPLYTTERSVGALNLYGRKGRRFGPRDTEIMALFAPQAAVAIENARLYEQARTLAVAEERNRMAREIHDTLAQGFTGILLQLQVAESLLDGEEPDARARLQRAQELARSSLREARRSVWNLRPSTLQGRTLAEALRDHLGEWRGQTGIGTNLIVVGEERPLAPATEETLLRVAQEALNNAYKHARASHVEVTLVVEPERVKLRVCDDGVGLGELARPSDGGGFGLVSMRERAGRLGGTLEIESAPDQGTCVVVTVGDNGPPARRAPGSVPG